MADRPHKYISLKCTGESFFRAWIEFLTPYHRLARRERDVFATIMAQYFRLKSQCDDPAMVRTLLWSSKSRVEMRRILNMSQPHFQMVLAKLRERGALMGEDINPRYIPNITEGNKSLQLCILFDWSTPEDKQNVSVETK